MDFKPSRMAKLVKEYLASNDICFDDILMVPQYSEVVSRSSVDLKMHIGGYTWLDLPVIASPMDTVCEKDMAIAIAESGGIGIIHRFMSAKNQIKMVEEVYNHNDLGLSVGAALSSTFVEEHVQKLIKAGVSMLLIDTANGHSSMAIDAVIRLKNIVGDKVHVMAGNVATIEGYIALDVAGADSVRVGIGGGSMCTTRIVSGHGIPTLSSIINVREAKDKFGLNAAIVADGGIRNTGDMVKAFAAGADSVMLGSMLAGTDESPGSLHFKGDKKFKVFRGMASKEANKDKDIAVAEGVSTMIPYKGSVKDIIKNIKGGIGSGCSYSGVDFLCNLYQESMYIRVSPLTVKESLPHGR
jgi:IMP dehydrogenase